MKNVLLLGATGSIGTQTLDIIRNDSEYRLAAFSFGKNVEVAKTIIEEFKPELVCASDYESIDILEALYPDVEYTVGDLGLQIVATYDVENPVVINALVGAVGLMPTACAVEVGRDVLLANKETLVIGGEIITKKAKEKNVEIVPIDSEHSAIYQLLKGQDNKEVSRLLVTASGGSFRDRNKEDLKDVTVEDALNHPNWKMGAKITIDSATMMNKGFELIEAYHLFGLDIDNIVPVMHRESIIHSMVEFKDGSIFAQLGTSDMHLPIQYAIYKKHLENKVLKPLDITKVGCLHFAEVDYDRYPLVKCAIDSLKLGKLNCTILNAANEAAVKLFLDRKIKFLDIETIVIEALGNKKYLAFNEGDISIPKIMALHNLVYNEIMTKFI